MIEHIQRQAATLRRVAKKLLVNFEAGAAASLASLRKTAVRIRHQLSTFNALHSSVKMDHIDYTFKFSTELTVLVLSFLVVAVNATGLQSLSAFSGSNLFAKELSYHPSQNENLYAEARTVKTVVAQPDADGNAFIPQADAQVVLAADSLEANDDADATSTDADGSGGATVADGNSITKLDTSSARTLVLDQIKCTPRSRATRLASVAQKFGITTDTIVWANNLPSQTISAGWDLLILPTSGVLHKVTANDTLPDIASYFGADINQIISYNDLADDSDINPGRHLVIPGGTVPVPKVAPTKPTAKPKPRQVKLNVGGKIYYEPAPPGNRRLARFGARVPVGPVHVLRGRAAARDVGRQRAQLAGQRSCARCQEGRTPIPGAIVVTGESRYGHVAVVEKVDGDDFTVTEMNYKGRGIIDTRTLSLGDGYIRGFIY